MGHIILPLSVRTAEGNVWTSHFVVLFMSLQLLLQNLIQGFETCNTVQTCNEHMHSVFLYEHMHKGNRSLMQNYVFLNDTHILIISHCSTVHVSATSPTVFDAGI